MHTRSCCTHSPHHDPRRPALLAAVAVAAERCDRRDGMKTPMNNAADESAALIEFNGVLARQGATHEPQFTSRIVRSAASTIASLLRSAATGMPTPGNPQKPSMIPMSDAFT